jgi:hypothetical protein
MDVERTAHVFKAETSLIGLGHSGCEMSGRCGRKSERAAAERQGIGGFVSSTSILAY